jgi:subtilisin-like proprotein convertase family protein
MRTGRTTARVAAAALATASVMSVGVAAGPGAIAASGSFTQPNGITINDGTLDSPSPANPYPSALVVSGLPNGVTDVNVTLNGFTHTFPDDIDVMLVGPAGQHVILLSDAGSLNFGDPGAANLSLVFDDQASGALPDDGPLAAGTFRPSNFLDQLVNDSFPSDPFPGGPDAGTAAPTLSAFNGTNPNGAWQLYVVDDAPLDAGALSGWGLQITTVDLPATPAITAPRPGTFTRSATVVVSGTAPAGTTVRLFDNAAPIPALAPAGTTGAWTFALVGLPNGVHSFTATATDALNTSSASPAVTVTVDRLSPTVVATSPRANARRVKPGASVTARFGEAMRAGAVTRSNVFLVRLGTTTKINARVSYNAATETMTLNPTRSLAHRTTYVATVTTKVLDLAGNVLDGARKAGKQAKVWRFTTR